MYALYVHRQGRIHKEHMRRTCVYTSIQKYPPLYVQLYVSAPALTATAELLCFVPYISVPIYASVDVSHQHT